MLRVSDSGCRDLGIWGSMVAGTGVRVRDFGV